MRTVYHPVGIVEIYRPDMEAGGHILVASITPGITLTGGRRLLQQLLTNLLDNALTPIRRQARRLR
jgi:signal transduction histidine kinase